MTTCLAALNCQNWRCVCVSCLRVCVCVQLDKSGNFYIPLEAAQNVPKLVSTAHCTKYIAPSYVKIPYLF